VGRIFSFVALAVFCGAITLSERPAFAAGFWKDWQGDIFAGYDKSSGNTNKASGHLAAQAIKKFGKSEFTLKGSAFYSESEKKMDGQKWDGLAKFSRDFGRDDRWFMIDQVYVDHDYFADIYYRVTPTAGLGYHFSRVPEWIWDVDAGAGYRITRRRVNKSSDTEAPTALVHTFAKKQIFKNSFLSEDFTVYPGLKADAGVVIHSVTEFTNPINESLDLTFKYILDNNSAPADGKKKTDSQFIAGIKYKF